MVARLLGAKSPTAACGGCREGDFGAAVEMRRSEQQAGAFRAPQEGDQSIMVGCPHKQIHILYRGVAQLVARLLWEQDAAGSSPVTSTKNGAGVRLLRFFMWCVASYDVLKISTDKKKGNIRWYKSIRHASVCGTRNRWPRQLPLPISTAAPAFLLAVSATGGARKRLPPTSRKRSAVSA